MVEGLGGQNVAQGGRPQRTEVVTYFQAVRAHCIGLFSPILIEVMKISFVVFFFIFLIFDRECN